MVCSLEDVSDIPSMVMLTAPGSDSAAAITSSVGFDLAISSHDHFGACRVSYLNCPRYHFEGYLGQFPFLSNIQETPSSPYSKNNIPPEQPELLAELNEYMINQITLILFGINCIND